jgi:hypothetical protein
MIDPFGTVTTDLERVLNPDAAPSNAAPELRGGEGPNRNLPVISPAAPPLSIDPLPAISYGEAESRKAELFANEEWRTKYFAGDVEAKREYDQIVQGLTTPPPPPTNERELILEQLGRYAQVFPAAKEEVLSGQASTPADIQEAIAAKEAFFQDQDWMERYAKGGRKEHAQVATINLILSRRVRDNPFES